MKKLYPLLVSVLLLSPSAFAGWGIHGGWNFANSSLTPSADTSVNTGLIAGIHHDASLLDVLDLEVGVQYAQRGFSLSNGIVTDSARINYIEVPILLKVGFPSPIRPFVEAGPNFGFRLSSSCANNAGAACGAAIQGLDTHVTDVAWEFGLGVELGMMGLPTVTATGRYLIANTSWATTNVASSVKHEGFEFLLGLNL